MAGDSDATVINQDSTMVGCLGRYNTNATPVLQPLNWVRVKSIGQASELTSSRVS